MDRILIDTAQNIALDFEPGTLGDRILGALVDWGVLLAYGVTVLVIYLTFRGIGPSWIYLVLLLPLTCYNLVMETCFNGQSLGKKAMHIRVISLDGERPTLGQYLVRWLFRLVDFLITENLCAVLTVALSGKRQRLGDMIAGTAVIKLRRATTLSDTLYVPLEVDYTPRYPEAEKLSAADMEVIGEALSHYRSTGNTLLIHHTAEKTAVVLGTVLQGDPVEFLQTVLEDYNYLATRTS
jgi:uncharacterized RDD family membrane protein YckC